MAALSDLDLGLIIGRVAILVGEHQADALVVHIKALTNLLDEATDMDTFGTEGWRHRLGIDR